ncbi:hypothetical protein [Thermonema rossianum]|uniref:hypothetical protein n=1 Tax=Thermonema rossianum TaxID=55505 RepID=UPI00056E1946|nr:hypothetical protein [Thermonema rossianum]
MEIIKTSIEWARNEVFSSAFFILFGALFLSASAGFWQLGKTDLAKAYVVPTLIAGTLLLVIGIGLVFSNQRRLATFEEAYRQNPVAFVESEIVRTEKTIKEYQNVVFTAIPIIIIVAALCIIFINGATWRASMIITIAMMSVILIIDSNAKQRMEAYHQKLIEARAYFKQHNTP